MRCCSSGAVIGTGSRLSLMAETPTLWDRLSASPTRLKQ
jgi:hypothetical protein